MSSGYIRRQGEHAVEALHELERSDLSELGLQPSDLLRRWRVILLVEGHHDELLIRADLGDELHDARVHIVPVDGASRLAAAIDSQLLWEFTEAVVIPVVDNAKLDELTQAWEAALYLAAAEGTAAAVNHLNERLASGDRSNETRWLRQFLIKSISKGDSTSSRISPFAFAKPDITDYLPVAEMLPERPDATWESLREEQLRMEGKSTNFKGWLAKRYRRQIFTDEAITAAAHRMDVPEEFRRLLEQCTNVPSPKVPDR